MPHFVTSEGDDVVLARACYRHNRPDGIRQVLESLDEFDLGAGSSPEVDGSVRFGWYETQPDPRSHAPLGGGQRILATLTLASTTLEVETMSQQRLDKCCLRLEEVLGDRIHLLEMDVKDVRRAMREDARRPRSEPEEPFIPPPEFIAEMEDKMLRQWIDEFVPALGGLTPRERVRLGSARKIVVLTGAGVSAESGVPTFRGAGGLWRRYAATSLATPEAWQRDPGLVWEFYNYRRQRVHTCAPNPAHHALAAFEARWQAAGGAFTLLTQNIDGLHEAAGSRNVVRLHGSLWELRCLDCGEVVENRSVPITPAFEGSGSPDPDASSRRFTDVDLPHCHCGGIQRPHVVWFGEALDPENLAAAAEALDQCQVMLVVGTSAVVYPAAGMAPLAKRHGAIVAEVNVEPSGISDVCDFFFLGKAGEVLSSLLDVSPAYG